MLKQLKGHVVGVVTAVEVSIYLYSFDSEVALQIVSQRKTELLDYLFPSKKIDFYDDLYSIVRRAHFLIDRNRLDTTSRDSYITSVATELLSINNELTSLCNNFINKHS